MGRIPEEGGPVPREQDNGGKVLFPQLRKKLFFDLGRKKSSAPLKTMAEKHEIAVRDEKTVSCRDPENPKVEFFPREIGDNGPSGQVRSEKR